MHPRIDQLLSWRDGAPVDIETREHAEHCVTCAVSVRRLTARRRSLQELPQVEAPDIEYSRILARAQEVRSPMNKGNQWRAIAAAAIVAAVVAEFVVIDRQQNRGPQHVQIDESASEAVPLRHEQGDPAVARLVEQSRELDEILQKMPRRPEVQRVSMAGTVEQASYLGHGYRYRVRVGRGQVWVDDPTAVAEGSRTHVIVPHDALLMFPTT